MPFRIASEIKIRTMKKKMDKIRFAGWYAPNPEDELIKRYSESGLNYMFLLRDDGYTSMNIPLTEKYLSLLDKYDVKAYLRRDKNFSIDEVIKASEPYKKYKSFKGYCIVDEPDLSQLDDFKSELNVYRKSMKDYDFFINLYPSYASEKQVGKKWENYINEFINKILANTDFGEKWLSFDFYPICFSFDEGNFLAENWLSNTQLIADNSKKYGAYFNAFVQSMSFSGSETTRGLRDRVPSFNDIMMQEFTYLAFNADMISFFCYDTPPVMGEFLSRHYAMIDRNENLTPVYDSVKKVNSYIKDFEKRYVLYNRIDTYAISKDSYYMFDRMIKRPINEKIAKRIQFDFDGHLLLGAFENNKDLAFIPINFGETTCNSPRELSIIFKNKEKIRISKKGVTKELEIQGSFVIYLDEGEGCFIELLSDF